MDKLKALIIVGFLLGAVGSCVLVSLSNKITVKENVIGNIDTNNELDDYEPSWHYFTYVNQGGKMYMKSEDGSLIPLGAEATVANSGFLSIYFVNHSASASTLYARNTSTQFENWSKTNGFDYSKSDAFNLQLKANTPFDIIIRCKFVRTAGPWNGTKWIGTNVRVNLTISGDFTVSNELGTWKESYNSSSSQSYYGNAYWISSGGGYQLHPGTSITISSIVISAKY